MPSLLSDLPFTLFLVLAAAFMAAAVVWFNRRTRRSLYALLGVGGALILFLLCDFLVESPREEAVRRVQEMVSAADTRNAATFVTHLADSFRYTGESGSVTITREQIRHAGFWGVLAAHGAHVAAWDFSRDDVTTIDDHTVEIGFLAKGEAGGKQLPMYLRATFTRQPDGSMKLTALASFHAMRRTNERQSIPFFP